MNLRKFQARDGYVVQEAIGHTIARGKTPVEAIDNAIRFRASPLVKPPQKCTAILHHGPGHQSRTCCQLTEPHTVHSAIYGRDEQEATWTGQEACTGFFNEPPQEN